MGAKEKTILIVDDEEDIRDLVALTLDDSLHRIRTAVDGETALAAIQRHCPDLVILDWMMPGFTGPDVIQKLREHPHTSQIPIILLTGRDDKQGQARIRDLGVFSYLSKPFSPLELLQKVREALAIC